MKGRGRGHGRPATAAEPASKPSSKGKEREVPPEQAQNPPRRRTAPEPAREVIEILSDGCGSDEDQTDEENGGENGQNGNEPPPGKVESNASKVKLLYETCGVKLEGWTVDEQRQEISVSLLLSLEDLDLDAVSY
jgi:hypothetical protein